MSRKLLHRLGWILLGAASLAAGCAEERHENPNGPESAVSSTAPTTQTAIPETPAEVAVTREPAARALVATNATGGTVQLASLDGRDLLLIADEDASAVRVVDAATLKEVSHHTLAGRPAQLVVAGDGRVYVALRDVSRVVSLEMHANDALVSVGAPIDVAPEPVALATDPTGQTLVVTSAWGARLTSYDVTTHDRVVDVSLPREPRGVTVSADGKTAHVAHAVGSRITQVSLAESTTHEIVLAGSDFTPRPIMRRFCHIPFDRNDRIQLERDGEGAHIIHERDAVQGFAVATLDDRVFVPQVLVHRGEVVVGGYGASSTNYPAHQPVMAIVDGTQAYLRVPNQVIKADDSRYSFAGGSRQDACLLPRAAVADANSHTVLVACMGTNEVQVIDSDTTTSLGHGTRARWQLPAGPTGIAIDAKRKRAIVWSQFAHQLAVIDLAEPRPDDEAATKAPMGIAKLPAPNKAQLVTTLPPLAGVAKTLSASAVRGRELFHAAGDRRISADGRACASCHPDGREDGLVWPTPFGARQTPMLAGRLFAATTPFGWQGDEDTVQGHVKQTLKRLGGTGLGDDDLDALVAYCHEMATPPAAAADDPALLAHGKKLFFADTVGCGTCHKNGDGSDGNRHEVGSGPKLDTPSLRFVSGTAPYFHDGRYATLSELLEHSQGKMGWGNELTARDRQALEAYLRTL